MKVTIYKNPNGDSRTAVGDVSFEEFLRANDAHINEVIDLMKFLANSIEFAGNNHDITKLINDRQFYKEFNDARNGKIDFTNGSWYQTHIKAERHHLNSHCPEDVTLIDVLEMIADNVAAGLARSGEVRPVEIGSDILQKAVANTVKLLEDSCEVREAPIRRGDCYYPRRKYSEF